MVVTNNTFGPGGCSDGIQVGSYGVVVGPGNVFTGIVQGSCAQHVDAIQGYGQSHTTVKGNYFINNTVDLGFYDGGDTELFTDNVIEHSSADGQSGQLGTQANPVFRHNTVKNATISFNGKPENGPSTNLLLQDNLLMGSSSVSLNQNGTPACNNCTVTHNLFASGSGSGTNNILGAPTFMGGASPSTWAGYQLAAGSLGKAAATDGQDMGTTYSTAGTITPPPPPPSSGNACDVNHDTATNVIDIQLSANQSRTAGCLSADINQDGSCNIVDVQRVVNKALGGACVTP